MRAAKAPVLLDAFDYDGVHLLPGRCADQTARAREVYFSLPDDDILKGFRQRAGLPAPGAGMRGWCAETSSCIFGQLLSGMARLSRATDDAPLRNKALALFDGWRRTVPPGADAGMRVYDWEKLVCGLVDLHAYAGCGEALPVLEESTAWAERTFDRTRRPADNFLFQGDGPRRTIEWYTLPENLYRAYLLGGDPAFKAFAGTWLYEDYWRRFAESACPGEVVAVHAYSHVNSLSSAAMAYAVTGDRRYLDICVHAYDFLQATQCYATGGYGPDERLMPPDGALGRSLELYAGHAEIPCGSWAAFKLSRYLMTFTGEARFGDWIETLLYNGIGAALPTEPDGRTFYYGDYRLSSGIKQYYWHEWPCCSGTYLQTVADYHNVIYFKDASGVYVNLFVPSEATWRHAGQPVTVRQQTEYPESETSTLTLSLERPMRMAVAFQVPGWSHGARLAVNGDPAAPDPPPGDMGADRARVAARRPDHGDDSPGGADVPGGSAASAPRGDSARPGRAGAGRGVLPQAAGTRAGRGYPRAARPRDASAVSNLGHRAGAPQPLSAAVLRVSGVLAVLGLLRPRRGAAVLGRATRVPDKDRRRVHARRRWCYG